MIMPKVSVVMLTYNHEKYIKQSIESILKQTFTDFELIIIDDGSSDGTGKEVAKFNDERIRYYYHSNMGNSFSANLGVSYARTNYVALMSGDDFSYPDRLEKQYQYFLDHSEATIVFGRVSLADEEGNILLENPLEAVFNNFVYPGQYEMFRHFFFDGNCLNAVTCMMRKDVFLQGPQFQVASLQLQDYILWFEWVKKFDLVILDDKLVYYRVRANDGNLSSPKNIGRVLFENEAVLERILDDVDVKFFQKAFAADLLCHDSLGNEAFLLEQAFIFLKHSQENVRKIGLRKLFYLLQDSNVLEVYCQSYHKTLREYYQLTENKVEPIFKVSSVGVKVAINLLMKSLERKFLSILKRIKLYE